MTLTDPFTGAQKRDFLLDIRRGHMSQLGARGPGRTVIALNGPARLLPRIALTFHTSPVRLSIAVTAYLVSLAVFIPMSGWMSDRYGAKKIFNSAICLFTVNSVLCGLSNNLLELTAMRLLQGMGGAMMIPVGRLVVLRSVPKSQYVQAMMMVLIPAQIGPVLGPLVGGFITAYVLWRWIFLINAPIGMIGLLARFYSSKTPGE